MKKKLLINLPWLLILTFSIIFLALHSLNFLMPGEERTITSATLTKAIDIAELSTSQFTYNGIAQVFKDEQREKNECYIRYFSKVKAGIDMKKVSFEIDDEAKTVTPILPDIVITANIVDENSLSFMPNNVTIDLRTALVACKEDALSEATQSAELFEVAEDNLKSIIEALLYPLLESSGYNIKWA